MGWEEDVDVLLSMEVLLLGIARFSFICDHAQQNNVTPLTLPCSYLAQHEPESFNIFIVVIATLTQ
jgi:hypothetical protein